MRCQFEMLQKSWVFRFRTSDVFDLTIAVLIIFKIRLQNSDACDYSREDWRDPLIPGLYMQAHVL